MTVEDPRWDDESRAWALALERFEDEQCPRCGLPMSVCQSPDNDGMFDVEPPIRCHAMTALSTEQDRYEETPVKDALIWTTPLLRKPRSG